MLKLKILIYKLKFNLVLTFYFYMNTCIRNKNVCPKLFYHHLNLKPLIRLYSTNCNDTENNVLLSPKTITPIIFSDSDKDKLKILEYGKGRSGIYM